MTVGFKSAGGQTLQTVVLGPVTAANRNNVTGLFQRSVTGIVPALSRVAHLELLFVRSGGNANDGYADSISLVLTPSGSL